MATITARKVDDRDYAALSEAAAQHGRSISEELRILIAQHAAQLRARKLVNELRDIRERTKGKLGEFADSVDLIRAIRDE